MCCFAMMMFLRTSWLSLVMAIVDNNYKNKVYCNSCCFAVISSCAKKRANFIYSLFFIVYESLSFFGKWMEGYCLMHFLSSFICCSCCSCFYILYRKCRKFVLSKIFIFFRFIFVILLLSFSFACVIEIAFYDCGLVSSKKIYEKNKICFFLTNKKFFVLNSNFFKIKSQKIVLRFRL